jgi:hypothetical protein
MIIVREHLNFWAPDTIMTFFFQLERPTNKASIEGSPLSSIFVKKNGGSWCFCEKIHCSRVGHLSFILFCVSKLYKILNGNIYILALIGGYKGGLYIIKKLIFMFISFYPFNNVFIILLLNINKKREKLFNYWIHYDIASNEFFFWMCSKIC